VQVLDLLTLSLLPGVGPRTLRDLLARGPLADALVQPEAHVDLLGDAACDRLRSGSARRAADDEMRRATEAGVSLVGWDDAEYPERLRRIYDPPPVLYVRGRLTNDETAVAVVGSRGASALGHATARGMGRDLARQGLSVVSGLARGIDTAAHHGALEAHGRTIAVLGSALDHVYPRENKGLAERIAAEGGAVVSELRMGTSPDPGCFPRRNRIIAGWSQAVVVVEAATRSGALITARVAADEGRDVYAVPGHPSHPGAGGTNQLIRDGAALVRDAADVLSEMGLEPQPAARQATSEDTVLQALGVDVPASLEDLQARSGRAIPELLGRLAELELASLVRRLPGGLYIRN
jgi:DNA processing protein